MGLLLEIISGDMTGKTFPLEKGMRIGRASAEIVIPDKKMSSVHAQIDASSAGDLVLVDQKSTNGLILNGSKVPRIALKPGVSFRMGRTQFRILDEDGPIRPIESLAQRDLGKPLWPQVLAEQVPLLISQNIDPMEGLAPFKQALRLTFETGAHADRVLVLGYGPRRFGSASLDIEIQDSHVPFFAFEIKPLFGEAQFENHDLQSVTLNNRRVKSEGLADGDKIRVGNSTIRVNFIL